jgi:excinuclease ABC subunit A
MCPTCNGLGTRMEPAEDLVVPDPSLSIRDGAIAPWASAMERGEGWTFRIVEGLAKSCEVDLDVAWAKLPKKKKALILHGVEAGKRIAVEWGSEGSTSHGTWGMRYEGVIPNLMRRYRETDSEAAREHLRKFFREAPCDDCGGKRLRPESLAVRVGKTNIADATAMTVRGAADHFGDLGLQGARKTIAEGALREISSRLTFLLNVGLDYLTLDRSGPTLSGGEAQRIRLASQLGSELSGVMYVLDEPSIGLHQRDNQRLIRTLQHLRDLGNTVLVVEHDEDTIRAADHLVDFGPGAGHLGGEVVFSGLPQDIERCAASITGAYLSGRKQIAVPPARRKPRPASPSAAPASTTCATSTSPSRSASWSPSPGSAAPASPRSSTASSCPPSRTSSTAASTASAPTSRSRASPPSTRSSPSTSARSAARPAPTPAPTPRSFDQIRELFAQLPESRARGWKAGRFSFNVKGGRCEACQGDGVIKVEMHFLSDVYVPCEVCQGKRYNAQTLAVAYKNHNIAQVLDLSVDDCLEVFSNVPPLKRVLQTLIDVGLGYMKIGQTAPTMSGGEAQRVKLSRELCKVQTGNTLYVLDEPTTGLHFEDIHRLLIVLQRLVDAGNTVLVIEHNLDVIKCADWIIDLGPEGGANGGAVIAEGTPEQVARVKRSFTGQYLKPLLGVK